MAVGEYVKHNVQPLEEAKDVEEVLGMGEVLSVREVLGVEDVRYTAWKR